MVVGTEAAHLGEAEDTTAAAVAATVEAMEEEEEEEVTAAEQTIGTALLPRRCEVVTLGAAVGPLEEEAACETTTLSALPAAGIDMAAHDDPHHLAVMDTTDTVVVVEVAPLLLVTSQYDRLETVQVHLLQRGQGTEICPLPGAATTMSHLGATKFENAEGGLAMNIRTKQRSNSRRAIKQGNDFRWHLKDARSLA